MINRRTMLKTTGAAALGVIVPGVLEIRKPIAYIITTDHFYIDKGKNTVNRAWHTFWTHHPGFEKKLDLSKYWYCKNVRIEAFNNIKDFPNPVKKAVELDCPPLTDFNQFHCFRTYDVGCFGSIMVKFDKDGSVW